MESWGAVAGTQSQRYEPGGLIRLVGVKRVRRRTVGRSAWETGQDVPSIAALSTSCTYRLPVVARIRAGRGLVPQ